MARENSRRTFLKQSASLFSALAAARCAPDRPARPVDAALDTAQLEALADAVLPVSQLGADGVRRVAAAFLSWLKRFEPVTEQPHGYGSAEVRYGPPDPAPRWAAQLEALDLEAERRHGQSFAALPVTARRDLIAAQLGRDGDLPRPARAEHIAVGLLAYFYGTSEATDLCYRARIGRETCRGLEVLPEEPAPLGEGM